MKRLRRTIWRWCLLGATRCVFGLGRLLYDLEIQGREHLPPKGPLILVGRHLCRFDFICVLFFASVFEDGCGLGGGVAEASHRPITRRIFAPLSLALRGFPSYKEKGRSAASLMEVYNLLRRGHVAVVGTEGELAWDGRLQAFQPGAAWLALRSGAPMVVSLLHGGYDIYPRWARRPRLGGKLTFRIGKPFYLSDAPYERVTKAMLHEANMRITAEMEQLSDGYLLRRETAR